LAARPEVEERIVHTGQHYDERMSQVFFDDLGIPKPAVNLQIGSGPHGRQTAAMLEKLEELLVAERPDCVLLYGDTNSTLAGALAAAKLNIPIAHVEAGLRSFNRQMPEEINRVLTDHVSALLFCPTQVSVDNLRQEGITKGVELVGDVMYDATQCFSQHTDKLAPWLADLNVTEGGFALATCHRAENTDDPQRLGQIVAALNTLAAKLPIVLPLHPRTAKRLQEQGAGLDDTVRVIEPVSYFEVLALLKACRLVVTDSGGLQKEAFFMGRPCVTMRDQTEWSETVELGVNRLAGAETDRILSACREQLSRTEPLPPAGPYYGDGVASGRIAERLAQEFK